MTAPFPTVSIIIPAYNSTATIERCLQTMLAQTYRPLEVVVVDSSPNDDTTALMRQFPGVRYEHSETQLLPHAARNRGTELASGELLLFTDPDIYAPPGWVEKLVAAHLETGHTITGAVACYGRRWVEVGCHLSKFDQWLPGGKPRPTPVGPTAALLIRRSLFEELGRFDERFMLADALLSMELGRRGHIVWFEPTAVAEHHHICTWGSTLREMASRGAEFAAIRVEYEGWATGHVLRHLLVTTLPLRLARLVWRTARNAARAGLPGEWLRTLPIVVSAQAAWLAGEASVYARRVRGQP